MTAWREEKVAVARHHQEKRDETRDWETCYR